MFLFTSLRKLATVNHMVYLTIKFNLCCRRAAATICPHPSLQRKRATAALSQAGRAGPDQPIRAIHPASRPHTPPADRMYATNVRQHHRLMPPGRGHNNISLIICNVSPATTADVFVHRSHSRYWSDEHDSLQSATVPFRWPVAVYGTVCRTSSH